MQEKSARRGAQGKKKPGRRAAARVALSPLAVLPGGSAIARHAEGRVLKDAEGLDVGSKVHVLLGVGSFDSTVTKVGD